MSEFKIFNIPNFFTAANMACGCIGIQHVFAGNWEVACYCIYLAAFVDFLDGFVARLFNATSELGKQLDSLCDVVSFGVLPGFIVYSMLVEYKWTALIIPIFSALRLAKFNIDKRQSDGFVGVPTPITALLISSLAFVFNGKVVLQEINFVLMAFTVFSSFMMITELPLISLKFKGMNFMPNIYRYILLAASIVFVVLLQKESFIVIYLVYLVLSIVHNKFLKPSV